MKQLYQFSDIDLLELFARRCQGLYCGEYDDKEIAQEILNRMNRVRTEYVTVEDDGPCFNCNH